jgi:hypothetical protein
MVVNATETSGRTKRSFAVKRLSHAALGTGDRPKIETAPEAERAAASAALRARAAPGRQPMGICEAWES